MKVEEAIRGRRSIRKYYDRLVDKQTVATLIEAAAQAPSAVNLRPWAFAVIQNKKMLKEYSDRTKALHADMARNSGSSNKVKRELADPEFDVLHGAGTLIVLWARPFGEHPDWDCCLAAQNLMPRAFEMGLGTCPIGFAWPLFEQADVKRELHIDPEWTAVMPIIVGYPNERPAATSRNCPAILC